jgi:hypothetical protein
MTKALVILLTALIAFSVASAAEAAFNLGTGVSKSNVHKTGWEDEDGEEAENSGDNEDDEGGIPTDRPLPLRIETAPKPGVVNADAPASKPVAPRPSNSHSSAPSVEKTAPKNSECKKYFPSVGMSLFIPCE